MNEPSLRDLLSKAAKKAVDAAYDAGEDELESLLLPIWQDMACEAIALANGNDVEAVREVFRREPVEEQKRLVERMSRDLSFASFLSIFREGRDGAVDRLATRDRPH